MQYTSLCFALAIGVATYATANAQAPSAPPTNPEQFNTSNPGPGIDAARQKRFHEYVMTRSPAPYRYSGQLVVGADLPEAGVSYYDVPTEYGAPDYRYAYVNDRVVLIAPRSRRVVQIIE